jgi:hypothetical protein
MFLAYTSRTTVDENGLMIRRLGSGTEEVPAIDIPKEISVRAISICPDKVSGAYPDYYVRGMHGDSGWAKVEEDVGEFEMDGITDNVAFFGYVAAATGETITINLYVKGQ